MPFDPNYRDLLDSLSTPPGWPMGEKCLVYSNATSSTMQCREILPHEQ